MKNELKLPFYLAFQSLRRGRKWTLFLTIFLMAVAFVNLIFVPALFNGIVEGSNQQIIDTLTGNVYLTPKEGSSYISGVDELKSDIATQDKVEAVASSIALPARIKQNGRSGQWPILAVDPAEYAKVFSIDERMYAGDYLAPDDTDGIMLGRQIAGGDANLELNSSSLQGVKVGDKVTVVFDGFEKVLTVRGIFYTKFVQSDARAFITEKAFLKIMPKVSDKATTINVRSDRADEEAVLDEIKSLNIDVDTYLWTEAAGLMKSVSGSFTSINVLLTIVGAIIAAITTFIVIYVDIVNRRRQIGILRAIGIRPYIIVTNYVLLAAVYAAAGILIGSAIFFLILVPYFNAHPFSLPITDAVLRLTLSEYILRVEIISWAAIISGLIPAILVTRTKMLDAIGGR